MTDFPIGTVTFLFTDVVASSRLWENDSDAMERSMTVHDEIMKTKITTNGGVFVKSTGDGAFAAFSSAFDAVKAATSIQAALRDHAWEPGSEIEVRIGLHTGEAELRDQDYFGSSVNRTARVMSAAGGGEVLLSLTTQEVVRDRLSTGLGLTDLGEKELKGFTRPEHVFLLSTDRTNPSPAETQSPPLSRAHPPAADRRAAWVAVLPFDNMSGDPEQGYFADGITKDIITGLAGWHTLRVISGTSSFHYRGTDATLDDIAKDLGVTYLLEGSVRKAGRRIRVTAQLIDVKTKHHIWAEKYDAELEDIFDIQDKITQSIVVAIFPAIRLTETTVPPGDRSQNLEAWDYLLLGRAETDKFRRDGNRRAIEYYQAALAIDPTYSAAHSGLAFAHFMDAWVNVAESRAEAAELAYAEARRAIELNPQDAMAHAISAYTYLPFGRLEAMASSAEKAIGLNPSLPYGYHALGVAMTYLGDHAAGLQLIDKAITLAPHDPGMFFFLGGKAMAYLQLHDFEDAVATARLAIRIKHGYLLGRVIVVSALGHMGDTAGARRELDTIMEINPEFSTALLDNYPLLDTDRALIDEGVGRADPATG